MGAKRVIATTDFNTPTCKGTCTAMALCVTTVNSSPLEIKEIILGEEKWIFFGYIVSNKMEIISWIGHYLLVSTAFSSHIIYHLHLLLF